MVDTHSKIRLTYRVRSARLPPLNHPNAHWWSTWIITLSVFGGSWSRSGSASTSGSSTSKKHWEDYDPEEYEHCDMQEVVSEFEWGALRGLVDLDGRFNNDFGVVLGPYSTIIVRLKSLLPDGGDLLVCYAASCKYDVPAVLEIFCDTWRKGRQAAWNRAEEPAFRDAEAQAYDALKCDSVACLFAGMMTPCVLTVGQVAVQYFYEYPELVKWIGEDLPSMQRAWAKWSY